MKKIILFISYDYDGNRVVKISPSGEETALTKELGALISIKNSYEKLNAKILSQRLSKKKKKTICKNVQLVMITIQMELLDHHC